MSGKVLPEGPDPKKILEGVRNAPPIKLPRPKKKKIEFFKVEEFLESHRINLFKSFLKREVGAERIKELATDKLLVIMKNGSERNEILEELKKAMRKHIKTGNASYKSVKSFLDSYMGYCITKDLQAIDKMLKAAAKAPMLPPECDCKCHNRHF